MSELKSCPFCGSEAGVEWKTNGNDAGIAETVFGVTCIKCGVATRLVYDSRAEAVEAWNRRCDNDQTN